jgi:hypothetical protein
MQEGSSVTCKSAFASLVFSVAVQAAAVNPCDLNGDAVVNLLDLQLANNMALGLGPCTANIVGAGICNIVTIQRVINAALNGVCVTGPVTHSVTLSWTASTSSNVAGYNVYRGIQSGGPYTKLTATVVKGTTYIDNAVQAGKTCYYVATAVDNSNNESAYSAPVSATVPTP